MAQTNAANRQQQLHAIWSAMIAAVGCYGVVHYVLGPTVPSREGLEVLGHLFVGFAVVNVGLAWWWFRWAVGQASVRAHALDDQQRMVSRHRLFVSAMVVCVLLETPAVFGLADTLLGASPSGLFWPLTALSLVGLAMLRLRGFPVIFQRLDQLAAER